jgi:NAD(P)-dependent dehydrogenase (short-subunit alcohol dehydrogenase family)
MSDRVLEGKSAIITGGGHGIGLATARILSQRGANVILADLNEKDGKRAEAEIAAAGGKAAFVRTDVSREKDVNDLVRLSVSRFGRLDILVNNAGVIRLTPLLEISEQEWDLILDVNLKGTFLCAKAAVPEMVRNGGGCIVNTASPVFQRALADCGHYIAAKGGVASLTKAMALEWGPLGVRVNCVVPGPTETSNDMMWPGMSEDEIPPARLEVAKTVPLGRLGKPEDVARASAWLCMPDAAFVTGAILPADGGAMTLHRGHVPTGRS